MKIAKPGVHVIVVAMMMTAVLFTGHLTARAAPQYAGGTVNFASWSSNPTESAALKKVLAAFQSKYHISVNYTVLNGDYDAALQTRMTAGTAPDVFYINSDRARGYQQLGVLHSLDFLKSDKSFGFDKFYKNVQEGFVYKGHTYGFAKDYSTLALWYNKDLFKAAGISGPPTTWAQFQSDACKLTDKSKKQYGAVLSADPARWLAWVYQAGGTLLNKNQTKAQINSKAGKQALDYYAGLFHKGCAATPSTVGAGWNGEAFGRQNAAMVVEGNWMTSYIQTDFPGVHWGAAMLPKGPKGNGNLIFTASYSMWAKTPHFKQASTLIKYLASKQGEALWAHEVGYVPSRKDVKPLPGQRIFIKQVKYAHSWFFPPGFNDRALTPIGNDLAKVIDGSMSSSTALSDMQAKAQAALSGAP